MTNPATRGPDRPRWRGPQSSAHETEQGQLSPQASHDGHAGHRWMMLICCIPMIVIVLMLIVSGVVGSGALLWALACLAMMAVMMFMMPGGHNHK